jgi:hypothetical protein
VQEINIYFSEPSIIFLFIKNKTVVENLQYKNTQNNDKKQFLKNRFFYFRYLCTYSEFNYNYVFMYIRTYVRITWYVLSMYIVNARMRLFFVKYPTRNVRIVRPKMSNF